ncbi:DNA recombination protein RmuC [Sandaracinomonas limnophila]|uniref:DNA recombination protein RmuC n=1 Tax=Sandaracinomonas limnophila TaxID=1862386 RepID=A0A437PQS9_9BACT|nr:DNA recombination protein RmuC [Sandaracinomonas limnophila]RVU24601.1 DNA recombination protein RmuC [Sandaracinomonas limnophila]
MEIALFIAGTLIGIGLTYFLFQGQLKKYSQLESENLSLNQANAFLKGKMEEVQKSLEEQKNNESNLRKMMSDISNETILRQGKILHSQQEQRLTEVLTPLKEKLKDFEKKVDDSQNEATKQNIQLFEQIKSLTQLNQTVTQKTEDLTNALKGSNKIQGNWGEVILERVLESSGLVKDREYKTQFVTKNQQEDTIKPDAVIFLPDEKNIIIDSKVSLKAYEEYHSAEDGSEQKALALKAHMESLKNHIKLLSSKDYHSGLDLNSPDFTLLFIPIESGFALTMSQDNSLFQFAWERKIVLVSPSTLLATLRTIASVWKIENQTRNAIEIAQKAGDLYDKFVGFTEDMQDIGKHLQKAEDAHQKAFSKLQFGKGNLISRMENLKKMGINANKKLDISHDTNEENEN